MMNLWRNHRRLIVLLLAGGLILTLAAVTPHVAAGPAPQGTVPPPVGGATLPYAWLSALAPLLAVVATLLAAAGVAVFWKHR